MTACTQLEAALLDGGALAQELLTHRDGCPACRARWAEHRALVALRGQALPSAPRRAPARVLLRASAIVGVLLVAGLSLRERPTASPDPTRGAPAEEVAAAPHTGRSELDPVLVATPRDAQPHPELVALRSLDEAVHADRWRDLSRDDALLAHFGPLPSWLGPADPFAVRPAVQGDEP